MSPQLAAGLTALVGLCMVAGWLSAFRNRAYLGWLGCAFLTLSASLLSHGRSPLAATILLVVCLLCFLLALVAAVRETKRRVHEIRERHAAAEEAMLAMIQASREKEQQAGAGESKADEPPGEDRG